MRIWLAITASRRISRFSVVVSFSCLCAPAALAQPVQVGGEAYIKLPDLSSVNFQGVDGHKLLSIGILFCILALGFGLAIFFQLKAPPGDRPFPQTSDLTY